MKRLCQIIFVLGFLGLPLAGCTVETEYSSYEDRMNKGMKFFLKDLEACQSSAIINTRRSEGSEGAGERLNRKNSLFILCMKNNDWALRQ